LWEANPFADRARAAGFIPAVNRRTPGYNQRIVWQALIQTWIRNRLYSELESAARMAAANPSAANRQPPRRCQIAFLFALSQEAGGLVDRLTGVVTRHADGFTIREGMLAQRHVLIAETGVGRDAATKATRAVIDAHRPLLVVSTGFAGGLDERLRRGDIVIASQVAIESGESLSFDLAPDSSPFPEDSHVHFDRLLTVDRLKSDPGDKRRLRQSSRAAAVDMETFAVAQACRERDQPALALRIISDTVDDRLPREVGRLLAQKTLAGKLGALTGALMQRPSSVKDIYQLKEDALVASDRLAGYLEQIVRQLPAPKDDVSTDDAAANGE
jgi:adenosylhomocysteine nucleosidase